MEMAFPIIDSLRRSSPLCLLAYFLCSILSGVLLVEPVEFSLHRVQPVIASHQRVYLQSTSDASVEIPVAKERRREAYNKQAGSLKLRMSQNIPNVYRFRLTFFGKWLKNFG